MKLCVGTAKGIVILDPDRATPVMVSADPASVWALAQDCADPNLLYAGSLHNEHAGSARGRASIARSDDGGRSWIDVTPSAIRDEDVWAVATPPDAPGEVYIGTSHARLFHSKDGHSFRECAGFLKLPGRDRWTFPPPPHIPHVRSITFDPRNPNTMYVGVEEGGVFRSRDRGQTFEPLNQSIYADIHCILVDPEDSRRLYVTTGRGLYHSSDAGASWTYVRGLSRSYTVPVLVRAGESPVYTAAAAGPPPTWTMGAIGADALMFRSEDRGNSFRTIASGDGSTHSTRGMIMRLVAAPDNATLFGVLSDGTVIRVDESSEEVIPIAEKLPPAYDLAILP